MHGFKSAILPELKNCRNGTFEPVHEIQKTFWPKDFFLSTMKVTFSNKILTYPRVSQMQDLGQSEYKTDIFSKRTHNISKLLFNLGSYESLARLESKIRKCLFFDGSKL